ncbi:delta-type opioid receptor-like [Lineus longissimus]|uniref:delta-type opioid receptor-like n=1 Tax=Lineus longissimus TaxID=88925 RepID=UPI00315CD72C
MDLHEIGTSQMVFDESDVWLLYMVDDVVFYLRFILVVFGVPGNILTILVGTLSHNKKQTTSVYMIGLALSDASILLQAGISAPMWRSNIVMFWPSRELEFKFVYFVAYASAMTSGLVLAFMSVDRFVAIRYPLVAKRICTVTKAKVIVTITAVIVVGANVSTFFCHAFIKDSESGIELLIVSVPGHPVYEILFTNFQMVFGSIVPAVIIICSNIGIIITMRQASRNRAKMREEQKQDGDKSDNQLTRILVVVSVAYFVTTLPYRLFLAAFGIPEVADMYDMKDPFWNILFNTLDHFLFGVWLCNHAVNFYLYCLAGGKRYREDTNMILVKLFRCFRATREN